MKKVLCILLFSIGLVSYAQNSGVAYLPECSNAEKPKACTINKIGHEIHMLVTKEMRDSMIAAGNKYFSIAIAFIIDAEGKVIPSETRFVSELEALKEPALKYIADLPAFIPKGSKEKERRDVYFLSKTYILNEDGLDYHGGTPEEIQAKAIKSKRIPLDQYPVYPGCEGTNDEENRCIGEKMKQLFIKKFSIPRSAQNGQVRMKLDFVINEEGAVYIEKITGGNDDFHKEIKRIFNKIPNITPANINGIPVSVAFSLPITVNVN